MKSQGYSLWLVPAGKANEKYTNLVKKLAGESNAPVFQPHVTLLGDFLYSEKESIEKTKQLVTGQQPFTIEMEQIDYEDYFFRTLFVRARKTKPLLALNNLAKDIFNMRAIPYMPHMSLLYGDFPVTVKEKIIQEIGKNQAAEFTVNKVVLLKGGEIKDWQIIEEFEFTPTSEVETY